MVLLLYIKAKTFKGLSPVAIIVHAIFFEFLPGGLSKGNLMVLTLPRPLFFSIRTPHCALSLIPQDIPEYGIMAHYSFIRLIHSSIKSW